jgi:HD-GYP domain-containing protein (c-di-GMP phosphodiesterase class II)
MGIVFNRNKESVGDTKTGYADMATEEYMTRIELLYEIARESGSVSEVSEVLERILRATQQTLGASALSLFLIDEEDGELYSRSRIVLNAKGAFLYPAILTLESGIAGWVAYNAIPVLDGDVTMDDRFNRNIDEVNGIETRSIVAIPLKRGDRIIGVLEVINKTDDDTFDLRDLRIVEGFASTEAFILLVSMAATAIENINSLILDQALMNGYRNTAEAWASVVDNKDRYAYAHSRRVAEYTLMAASCFPFSPQELQDIEFGALFHDIGKIGIDSSILCKPGPLSDAEWRIMQEHCQKGASIVGEIPFLGKAKDIVLYHHERYDGSGYPENLKGNNIPIGARLVAVADAFDTMTTDHSYREALSIDTAIDELIEGIGTQFCPVAVEAFISSFKKNRNNSIEGTIIKKVEEQRRKANITLKSHKDVRDFGSDVYEGEVRLVVPLTVGGVEVRRFAEHLNSIDDLKIIMTGGSEDEGHIILLSVQKPMPLMNVINDVNMVESAEKHGKNIVVTLNDYDS